MQSTGYLISSASELTTCMKHCKYDFKSRFSSLVIHTNWNSTSIIPDRDGIIVVEYKELSDSFVDEWNAEELSKLETIQDNITELVGDQAKNLDLVNGKIDEEYQKLLGIYGLIANESFKDTESAYLASKQKFEKGYESTDGIAYGEVFKTSFFIKRAYSQLQGYLDETQENIWWGEQAGFKDTAWLGSIDEALAKIGSYEEGLEKLEYWRDLIIAAENSDTGFGYWGSDLWTGKEKFIDYDSSEVLGYLGEKIEEFREIINAYEGVKKDYFGEKANNEVLDYLTSNEIDTQQQFTDWVNKIWSDSNISKDYAESLITSMSNYLPKFEIPPEIRRAFIKDRDDLLNELNSKMPETSKEFFGEWIDKLTDAEYQTFVDWWSENQNNEFADFQGMVDAFNKYNQINKIKFGSEDGGLINELAESIKKYKATIETLQRALDEYANSGSVSTEAYNQVVALNEDYADIFDFSSGKIAIASEEVDKLVDELIAEYGATLATNGATEDQIANMVSLAKALSNTTDEVENVIEEVEDVIEAVEDLAEVLQNSIEDNPMTTLEAWELIDKYPELAKAITKTARGYTVEADAVRNLIKAKAELLRAEGVESGVVDTLLKDMESPDSLLEDVFQNQFEKIKSRYSGELQELEHLTNTINNEIKALKDKGYDVPTSYYEKLGEIEKRNINTLNKELVDLTEKFDKALSTNEIQEGTDEFYEMSNTINSVKEQIQESNLSLQSFSNTIRDIKWDNFNKIHEEIQKITDESEFLLELLDSKEMTDDDGNLTQFGNAALGLHGVNYNVYMEQAKRYAKEIANLEKDIANDKGNQTLIDRKKELLELQRESILAAEDEKQAMIDLVTEGIESELSAVDKLIDKYKDALDSVKDLYDYQNKITDITSEIGNLQKQIMAYGNDDSEETRAQIQKLKVDLEEAQEELQETEYDQFIADQKKLLDNLYTDYETILNRRIDDVDSLIIDSVNAINTNSSDIKATLESVAGNVGNRLSDKMQSIWTTSEDIGKVVSVYSGNFDSALGSTNENLGSIDDTIGDGFIEIGSDISTVGSTLSTIDGDIDNVNSSVGNVDASVDNVAGKLDGTNSELDLLLGKTDGTNIGIDNLAMRLNDLIAGLNIISSKIDATNSTISTISSKLDGIKSAIGNNSYTPPIISSGSGGAVNNGLSGSFNTNGTSNTSSGNVSTNTPTGTVNTYKTTGVLNSEDYSVSGLNNVSIGWDDCTVTIAGVKYEVATHDAEENTVSEPVRKKLNDLFGGTRPPAGTLAGLNGTVYVVSKDGSWVDFADKNKRNPMTTAFFATLNKYKDGGLADYTGLAWLDGTKSKPEMVLDAEDTENFIALRDILSKLASEDVGLGNPLYSAFDPISYRGSLPNLNDKLTQVQDNHNETVVENHIDINIPIEKVEDYNDFVTKLQEDGQFEKMVQAMTIGRLNGGSSLAKYNYRWKK